MQTSINGEQATWSADIWDKWDKAWSGATAIKGPGRVEQANYFTPRPYCDQYNRGSEEEGFTYTWRPENNAGVPQVWQTNHRTASDSEEEQC